MPRYSIFLSVLGSLLLCGAARPTRPSHSIATRAPAPAPASPFAHPVQDKKLVDTFVADVRRAKHDDKFSFEDFTKDLKLQLQYLATGPDSQVVPGIRFYLDEVFEPIKLRNRVTLYRELLKIYPPASATYQAAAAELKGLKERARRERELDIAMPRMENPQQERLRRLKEVALTDEQKKALAEAHANTVKAQAVLEERRKTESKLYQEAGNLESELDRLKMQSSRGWRSLFTDSRLKPLDEKLQNARLVERMARNLEDGAEEGVEKAATQENAVIDRVIHEYDVSEAAADEREIP